MLKRDKNGFIEIIESNGLSPLSFKRVEQSDSNGNPEFKLQLESSPLYFLVRTSRDSYYGHDMRYVTFAPRFPESDCYPVDGWMEIDLVYGGFEEWLKGDVLPFLEESEVVDLWGQLEGQSLLKADPLMDRTVDEFSSTEKAAVIESIDRFRELIEAEYHPSADQLDVINDRLEYLAGSLDRLNKVDWQGIAMSTVISISIALCLDTEKGRSLFNLFRRAFASMELLLRST